MPIDFRIPNWDLQKSNGVGRVGGGGAGRVGHVLELDASFIYPVEFLLLRQLLLSYSGEKERDREKLQAARSRK